MEIADATERKARKGSHTHRIMAPKVKHPLIDKLKNLRSRPACTREQRS